MVGVAGAAVAFHLSVNVGASGASMFRVLTLVSNIAMSRAFQGKACLKNDHSRAFTHDKAGTIGIERARCFFRSIIEISCQTSGSRKAPDGERMDARLGTTSNHHIGIAACNEPSCIADGMGTRGTSSCCGMIRTLRR